jgi:GH15 family glucan-1,4-alpha-glucosidase
MADVGRCDGYAPISAYAVLGDGRTVALVARDGAIDWFPVTALDARPAFAALLEPAHGGQVELGPAVEYSAERRYWPGTAVLETVFTTASGTVTVTDCLNRLGNQPLPWTELARLVRAERGEVPMRWRVRPGSRFGSAQPHVHARDAIPLMQVGSETIAVLTSNAGRPAITAQQVAGEFTAKPGTTSLLALVATDDEPLLLPRVEEVIGRVDATADGWRSWRSRIHYTGPFADAVARSALTLRLLTISATGASVAAPTTSLPEAVGGDRNYDYRFTWVRDASFVLDALTSLGLTEEVHATLSWLLRAVKRTAPEVHVFYTLGGEPAPAGEREIPAMPGYLRTGPVREGNGAASQRQLGCHGHLLNAAYHYVRHGGLLGPASGLLAQLADTVCDLWRQPDAGLWELRDYQHYTSSKLGCWEALHRAAWFAEHDHLPADHASRWRDAADQIQDWINQHCWSPRKQSYTMHPDTDDLDAAVLLMARTAFCRGDPQRLHSTIDAIRSELAATGPLIYRYGAMRGTEGAFAACTFWLAEALARAGRTDEARSVFEAMLGYCNDVGLLAEEIDPATGHFLGNFPQGLSHLALISAAHALASPPGRNRWLSAGGVTVAVPDG